MNYITIEESRAINRNKVIAANIKKAVCSLFNITEIDEKSHTTAAAIPRHYLRYYIKKVIFKDKISKTAKYFAIDHSTLINSIKFIESEKKYGDKTKIAIMENFCKSPNNLLPGCYDERRFELRDQGDEVYNKLVPAYNFYSSVLDALHTFEMIDEGQLTDLEGMLENFGKDVYNYLCNSFYENQNLVEAV